MKFERLSEWARVAMASSPPRASEARIYGQHKNALRYAPPEGLTEEALFSRMTRLKGKLQARRQLLIETLADIHAIDEAMVCIVFIMKLHKLMNFTFTTKQVRMLFI